VFVRDVLRAVCTFFAYLAAVLWLTFPLATQLGAAIPDTYPLARCDTLYGAWAMAWGSHALTTNPFMLFDANIYHPARHTLAYGQLGLGGLLLFAPTFLASGNPTLAVNMTILTGIALTATGLHLVLVRWTGLELAGAVAGWTFLCVRWGLYTFVPTAPQHAALQWFPWLVLLSASTPQSVAGVVGLAILIALQCLTDLVYVAPATLAPLAVLAIIQIARPATRASGMRLAAALGIALPILAPIYAAYLRVVAAEPNLLAATIWATPAAALERLGIPAAGGIAMVPQPAPWHGLANGGPLGLSRAALLLIVVGVALRLARRGGDDATRPGWRAAGVWAAVGIAVSVPAIGSSGDAIVLPHFALVADLAPRLLEIVRVPLRLGVAALIGLTLLAGLAIAEIAWWTGNRARLAVPVVAALVMVLTYGELRSYESGPYPTVAPIVPNRRVIEWLRAGSGPVLELPVVAEGTHAGFQASAMYRSIFHWRPLLNGYSSYFPTGYAVRMAVANDLPDPSALASIRRETNLATIVVHDGPSLPNRAAWKRAATDRTGPLVLVGRARNTSVFNVP
jgi:hypothetical protein